VDYLEEAIRLKICNQIKNLELPEKWTPEQVITYVVRKIEGQ
jgi:hypothetical protein